MGSAEPFDELSSGGTSDEAAPPSPAVAPPDAPKVPPTPSRADCEAVVVFTAGAPNGSVCAEDAPVHGLTVIDVSDTWTPRVFAVDPETQSAPEYRAKYLELASQPSADLGLYGIAPTITTNAARLTDEKRRACDAAVDLDSLDALRVARQAATDAAGSTPAKAPTSRPAILAAQAELACAGFMKTAAMTGTLNASTHAALDAFRRRHMIVGSGLDDGTLAALALGGDELAFVAMLRTLRERVAEAAGLVEDGSASETHALVVGRQLDLSRFAPAAELALDGGAPDLVGTATDAAARELGWTSPDDARAFLVARGKNGLKTLRVAVALPAAPAYHSATMDLRVEIDRGDVYYETPGHAAAARKKGGAARGPSFVVYAKNGETDVPLLRWATTIGGWKKERTEEGEIALKYKESDVGERVWRQVVAAPAWLPPDSTPETDLLKETKDGTFTLKSDLIQPGHRNAYGLVMLVHEEPSQRGTETRWLDHGIRTHGSVDYRSIQRGESHGCHRLYNQLALRLSGYLLEHRAHTRRGKMRVGYHRTLEHGEQTIEVDIPTRGYLYELDPPVPVRVLEGRIAGEQQKPSRTLIAIAPQENQG